MSPREKTRCNQQAMVGDAFGELPVARLPGLRACYYWITQLYDDCCKQRVIMSATSSPAKTLRLADVDRQIVINPISAEYWRVDIDNPPLNIMGAQMVAEFAELVNEIERDDTLKVVVFGSRIQTTSWRTTMFSENYRIRSACPRGRSGCIRFQTRS